MVSVSQFSTEGLQLLFEVAERMKAMVADKTDDATLRYAHMVAGVLDSAPARSLAECFSRGCGVAFLASFYLALPVFLLLLVSFFPGYFFPFFPPCMSILAHARGMFLSPELWLPFLFIYLFICFVLVSFVVSLFYKVFWFNEKNTKGGGGETGGVEEGRREGGGAKAVVGGFIGLA